MRHCLILLLLLAASFPSLAHAQAGAAGEDQGAAADDDARARVLFAEAREAYSSGDYEAAVVGFEEALELSGMGTLYYNIGLAHDRLRHDEQAVAAYRHYLEEVPDAAKRAEVEARIAAIEGALEEDRAEAAELAAARARAERTPETIVVREEAEDRSNLGLWLGIGGGVLALAVVGVILAVVLGGQGEDYQNSDFGSVTFALGAP